MADSGERTRLRAINIKRDFSTKSLFNVFNRYNFLR